MIQRVQSLFLLAATIFSGLMITIPFTRYVNEYKHNFEMLFFGLKNVTEAGMVDRNIPLTGVTAATGLISLVTIIIYRRRLLQMRFCVYNILLTFAQIGLILYYYFHYKNLIAATMSSFSFTIILPLVNIILVFQAFRAIRRDDLLIKSYDRLR